MQLQDLVYGLLESRCERVIMGPMQLLTNREEYEALADEPWAVIFKHSTSCGISAGAHGEVERFAAAHPEHRVYKIEVLESRRVSDFVETATGVRHESPQLLVLKKGEVVWHGSHGSVTAEAIAAALG